MFFTWKLWKKIETPSQYAHIRVLKKGTSLCNLCVKPHKKDVINIDSSWGLDVASFIGKTWKLWKKFETQTFSIMEMFEFQKGA